MCNSYINIIICFIIGDVYESKKNINFVFFVLIGIVILGIGYAAIGNINLAINGIGIVAVDSSNFNVKFLNSGANVPTIDLSPTNSISVTSNTEAIFSISTLNKKDDSVIATLKVKNESNGIGAHIALNLTNSNESYYVVTEHIDDNELQVGEMTTVTITVTMKKTPINDVTGNVIAKLIVSPLENSSAVGNDFDEVTKLEPPVSFTTDSWETIKMAVVENNTSVYDVGDEKEVLIDGKSYTLRIANKSTYDNCNDLNRSQTTCGFVVEFVDVVSEQKYNEQNTTVGSYPGSDLYNYIQNTLFEQLPEDLQSVISTTRVISGYGCLDGWNNSTKVCATPDHEGVNYTTYDNLFLLSAKEIYGDDGGGKSFNDTAYDSTVQLDYYRDNEVSYSTSTSQGTRLNYSYAIKAFKGTNKFWWLRTAGNYSPNKYFQMVNIGGAFHTGNEPTYKYGVAPAFRIDK